MGEASLALLDSLGHTGIGAGNATAALWHGGNVDAVLADYRLGQGEDGLSLIAALRALWPDLPAVLITAEDGADIWARAAEMGVNVLAKPVSPNGIEQFLDGVTRLAHE